MENALNKSPPKDTPGPWHISKMDNGYGFQILSEKGNRVMGSIANNGAGVMGQSAQAKANANLIATAPELLEMLIKVRKELHDDGYARIVLECDAVIKKAEGLSMRDVA